MALTLNAYPISFDMNAKIPVCEFTYSDEQFKSLRQKHNDTHAFYRMGERALCISSNEEYPVEGKITELTSIDNFGLMTSLIKDAIVRLLKSKGRNSSGFNPIEVLSVLPNDNVISDLFSASFPFTVNCKYEIDIRNISGVLHLTIDCSTKTVTTKPCNFFYADNFDLVGRYVVSIQDDGYKKLLGIVLSVNGDELKYQDKDALIKTISITEAYLEGSRTNFDAYVKHAFNAKSQELLEKVRMRVSAFSSGPNKKGRIEKIKSFLASKIKTITEIEINILDAKNITSDAYLIDKSFFVFNDNVESSVKDGEYGGLKKTGPYTRRTFDRNDPAICIICSQNYKGQVEQFVRKFLKELPAIDTLILDWKESSK